MNRQELLQRLSQHRAEIEGRFGVASLALFGSAARGEAGPASDIDLLVEFVDTPGLGRYMGLKFWLEDLLEQRVDLVMKGALEPWASSAVEGEAIRVA